MTNNNPTPEEQCNCPNGSYGKKHSNECYERRIAEHLLGATIEQLECANNQAQLYANELERASTPPISGQCEIVTIEVRDDKIVNATMKAPGLPDGLHDLFCADPREVRPLPAAAPTTPGDDARDAKRYRFLLSLSTLEWAKLSHVPDNETDAAIDDLMAKAALSESPSRMRADTRPLAETSSRHHGCVAHAGYFNVECGACIDAIKPLREPGEGQP